MVRLIVILTLLIISSISGFSQNVVEADANSCELNSLYADMIRVQVNNTAEKIYVIAYRGMGETEAVNNKRLSLVKNFLNVNKGWSGLTPVYAAGDVVQKQGRLDIYVGSSLNWVLKAQKNAAPCMDCCGQDFLSSKGDLLRKPKKAKLKR